ncbi:hypothetical protein LZ32DRAFT_339713 [Colletotrichum eremochloae]|nr:hypothetical protein LZ32DRAFT_339713 [Colletotrichum eremochloae]
MLETPRICTCFSACFVCPISLICFWQSALEYGLRKEGIMVSIYDGAGRTLFFFFVSAITLANNPGRDGLLGNNSRKM